MWSGCSAPFCPDPWAGPGSHRRLPGPTQLRTCPGIPVDSQASQRPSLATLAGFLSHPVLAERRKVPESGPAPPWCTRAPSVRLQIMSWFAPLGWGRAVNGRHH